MTETAVTLAELNARLDAIRDEYRADVEVARAKFDKQMQALANELGITLPRPRPGSST